MLTTCDPRPEPGLPPVGATDSNPEFRLPEASSYFWVKTVLDTVAALLLLVLTAPVILLAMLLVKLTSRGPALYTQTRLGRHGKPFTIYKIRTMVHECESLTGARWSTPGDARITRIGRFLRDTHLDELPQLWNVLRADMSLIGPRPERPEFIPHLESAIPHYRDRLLLRPGVSGLAQVQLPADTDLESVRVKLAYDLYYVQNFSWLLDLRLCLATACKMAGVPFHFLRSIFQFAGKETIEQDYNKLVLSSTPRAAALAKLGGKRSDRDPVPVLS